MMTNRDAERHRGWAQRSRAAAIPYWTLREVCARTGLSERWIRELIRRHGLNVRRVPCPGRGRFVFSRADVEQIESIHRSNQARLERRSPAFYATVGKLPMTPRNAVRAQWSVL